MQRVFDHPDVNYGFNAATGKYENLMESGIIDPTKVIRCALENSSSVARTFLMADVIVVDIPEAKGAAGGPDPATAMGGY